MYLEWRLSVEGYSLVESMINLNPSTVTGPLSLSRVIEYFSAFLMD